ncbi:Na+/H+ antiporter subunit A [Paenibacillus sp. y28]|uniref:Na+/H+ antiporter subunit A n=1 Tax=Paenibacillus sp. y28 TaxID=3129110 RepID=UPI00301B4473
MSLLHAAILLPFIASASSPLLHKLSRFHTGWLMLPVPVLLFVYFACQIPIISQGEVRKETISWIPSLGIDFTAYLDGLGMLFALLISGIGSLVILYSIFYLKRGQEAIHLFYVYLLLFMGAMLGVVLSDHMIVLYGFWELTSISSFLLIAFWHGRERSRYGALKSMLITVFGGLAMLAGFIMLYAMSGTFSIRELIAGSGGLWDHELFLPAMLLLLLGAFTKSAQFPFHIWLPDAMEAPTPVSAYLHSATMVKAGLYLVARFSPVFAGTSVWFWLVSGAGLVTLIYGSYRAMKQTDLKAMLAFSTISQLGLIMSLLGLGSAAGSYAGAETSLFFAKATTAALFHLVNHAVFKGTLFMVVGIVDHETGTRDIRKLGGLMAVMPITFTAALIGSFSMAGLPPFNGFLSKEMFFTAVLNIARTDSLDLQALRMLLPVIAWMASVFTFVYSMILLFATFTGRAQPDQSEKQPHEAPLGMLLPPVVLASLAVVLGLFPNVLAYSILEPAMAAIHPGLLQPQERFLVSISHWHGWTAEVFMTIGVVLGGTLLFKLRGRLRGIREPLFQRVTVNRVYDEGLRLLHKAGHRLTGTYMTGSLRHYLSYILVFLIVAAGWALLESGAILLKEGRFASVSLYEATINVALILCALAVPFARSRMTAIILTGAAGYMVTLFFVIFRAPDLALTQVIVETVSVALFLLCFYHLPKLKQEAVKRRVKVTNLMIALGVGTIMTLIALSVSSSRSTDTISEYFLRNSYKLAGGKNVVNVILVDFRGFDTLLEIVVLGIASYGIYALIKLRLEPDREHPALHGSAYTGPSIGDGHPGPGITDHPDQSKPAGPNRLLVPHRGRSNDVILQAVTKVTMFIIVVFSWYLLFAGHHHPGGGFIGGLMASAALVLLAMAIGTTPFHAAVPLDFRKFTATGLLVALVTGIGSFLFKAPFLSHTFGYVTLPLLGRTELATAMLFDLGVYMTVVGITMTIMLTIGRDK